MVIRMYLLLLVRLNKEYKMISGNPPTGVSIHLPSDADLFVWEALLSGPVDSVYKGDIV